MRRFKLLKELPDVKIGEIGYDDESGNVNWKTFLSKPDFSRARYLSYPLAFVEAKRDWFEEVKDEPEGEDNKIYLGISKCCNKPAFKYKSVIKLLGDCKSLYHCEGCKNVCEIYTPSELKKLGKIEPFCEQEIEIMGKQKEYTCAFLALKINELIKVVNSRT